MIDSLHAWLFDEKIHKELDFYVRNNIESMRLLELNGRHFTVGKAQFTYYGNSPICIKCFSISNIGEDGVNPGSYDVAFSTKVKLHRMLTQKLAENAKAAKTKAELDITEELYKTNEE